MREDSDDEHVDQKTAGQSNSRVKHVEQVRFADVGLLRSINVARLHERRVQVQVVLKNRLCI